MNREELDKVELMLRSDPWKLYEHEMSLLFENRYRQLRKCKKSDSLYERTNGFLDGIEKALSLLKDLVEENKADNSENEPAKGDVL